MILEEFDEEKRAIINPDSYENKVSNFPKIGITCFSQKLMDKYIEALNGKKIAEVRMLMEQHQYIKSDIMIRT